MTRIFQQTENVYNAADCVRAHGYAAIEGTLSSAIPYCDRVIKALSVHDTIHAMKSYLNVTNQGYLYFVYDANRYTVAEMEPLIKEIDLRSVR